MYSRFLIMYSFLTAVHALVLPGTILRRYISRTTTLGCASEAWDSLDEQALRSRKVSDLKVMLRSLSLPVTGAKKKLVERLLAHKRGEIVPNKATRLDQRPSINRPPTPRSNKSTCGTLRAVSWNVNGLRALLGRPGPLAKLLGEERPHILCFQETKLQDIHVDSCEEELRNLATDLGLDYRFYWACSTSRKGYSGVAMLIDRNLPEPTVRAGIGLPEADAEGRVLTATWEDHLRVTTAYVPNAGEGLRRLDWRVGSWDEEFASFLGSSQRQPPTLVCGDLNVAFADEDFFNPDEKRSVECFGHIRWAHS